MEPVPAKLKEAPSIGTHDVVVIGASAGMLSALSRLVRDLPADFPGNVFIAVHMNPDSSSRLAEILSGAGAMPVISPRDLESIVPGRIYVAVPDRHILIEPGRIRIVRGPRENRHRPAIDPLFRSAAWAYGPRVVGVVLTGLLSDGTAGLWAIKTCGGTTVVQDPADAMHPGMPQNALRNNDVDHCISIDAIGPLLDRLARETVGLTSPQSQPASIKTEIDMAAMQHRDDIGDMGTLGKLSPFTCPACHGALWEMRDGNVLRYRCHTGHAFTGQTLVDEQTTEVENALYSAARVMEEKATTLRRLSADWSERFPRMRADYENRAKEMEASIEVIHKLLARDTR